jgi:hypothetical protein
MNETNGLPLPQKGIFKLARQFKNIIKKGFNRKLYQSVMIELEDTL